MTTVHVLASPEAVGAAAASRIADLIQARGPRPFLLGCPGGRSAVTTYHALGSEANARGLDLSKIKVVMMDDYVTDDGAGPRRVDPSVHYSCERFAHREILPALNATLEPARQVSGDNVWLPDPAEPEAYERRIDAAGGIDFFILASGAGDGHVAFNPPGADQYSRTRIVELAEQTRRDNMATFPAFASLDQVPTLGVTVGVGTIARSSREAALVIHGHDKQTAFRRLTASTRYDTNWPATVIHLVEASTIYADEQAAVTQ